MPELLSILVAKREKEHEDKKFLAAIQGIDIDNNNTKEEDVGNAWENMKAKVFSGGATNNASDIVSLQGVNATRAGFGIGMGLEYEKIDK